MQVNIDLQIIDESTKDLLPSLATMQDWVKEALIMGGRNEDSELTVRFTDKKEIHELNYEYRNMDKPTNILSFPFECPDEVSLPLIGDLVICNEILVQEAKDQNKSFNEHLCHLLIHGALHLIGYDHIKDDEASIMEGLEIKVLAKIGFKNPYEA